MTSQDYLGLAQEQYQIARHLLTKIYPLVKDPKLFVGILLNIERANQALQQGFKIVPKKSNGNKTSPTYFLKLSSLQRKAIPPKIIAMMEEVHHLVELHQKTCMEFPRRRSFILCHDNYEHKVVDYNCITQYLLVLHQAISLLASRSNRKA